MGKHGNQGIQINGGTAQFGQAAVGDGARAEQTVYAADAADPRVWQEFARQVQALSEAIAANTAALHDAGAAGLAARQLLAEAQQAQPRPALARTLLQRLMAACGPVGGVLEAAAALKELLAGLA